MQVKDGKSKLIREVLGTFLGEKMMEIVVLVAFVLIFPSDGLHLDVLQIVNGIGGEQF